MNGTITRSLHAMTHHALKSFQQRRRAIVRNDNFIRLYLAIHPAGLGNGNQRAPCAPLLKEFRQLLDRVIGKRVTEYGGTEASAR